MCRTGCREVAGSNISHCAAEFGPGNAHVQCHQAVGQYRHGRGLGSPMGWVGLGLDRIFEISVGRVGLVQARTTSYNSIASSKILDTSFYDFNTVLQVFDFGLLWFWIHIGFQTRHMCGHTSCSDRFLDLNFLFVFISN